MSMYLQEQTQRTLLHLNVPNTVTFETYTRTRNITSMVPIPKLHAYARNTGIANINICFVSSAIVRENIDEDNSRMRFIVLVLVIVHMM